MADATVWVFVAFTPSLYACKTTAVQFKESAHWPNKQGIETVATLSDWINQGPTNLDVVTPIKARACDALQAVLKSKPRRVVPDPRLMPRGAERC